MFQNTPRQTSAGRNLKILRRSTVPHQ